jgi:hypothetical protein
MAKLRQITPNAPVINELEKEFARRRQMHDREKPPLELE